MRIDPTINPVYGRLVTTLTSALAACVLTACSAEVEVEQTTTAVKVEIVQTANGYQLMRGGEPYVIKGAGLEFGDITSLAAHGGNAIRTWTTANDVETAQEVLDKAHAHGVTVAVCLPMGSEHWGFDYDDPEAVAAQLESFRSEVLKYRDHPALLAWIIGNELNYDYTNPKVYDAVNEVSRMIHELDPNHPTTTTTAGLGANVVKDIMERAPDLDFVSFQVYGQLFILPEFLEETGYDGPFFVTEWGAIGWWEVAKTTWGAPIEATSTEKADTYLKGYREKLEPLEGQLIGSYVFLWGQKQERTPTWFGLFTEAGEKTEAVDVMHYIWNGAWPDNRSPQVRSMVLDGKRAADNVTLRTGQIYDAVLDVIDHEGDELAFRWELKPESEATQVGGAFEESIANLNGLVKTSAETARLTAPPPGEYRLFVYAYDDHGHAAHANIPFLVVP
ncbi:MAG: glycoside hydrolase family 2 TIM barrel-domain containing protein [Gammaproteobacteria bacterium]